MVGDDVEEDREGARTAGNTPAEGETRCVSVVDRGGLWG